MSEFLHMGGYAVFIWSSYGLAAAVLVGLLVLSLWQRHSAHVRWDAVNPRRGGEP